MRRTRRAFFLFEGEPVTVLQQSSNDWYFVRRANGEEGMAPADSLQPASVFYKAIADFNGQRASSQLAFQRGDIFNLLSFKSNDWLQARNSDGRIGLVPSAYVEEVAPPESFTPSRKDVVPPVEKGRVASRARVFSTPQSEAPAAMRRRNSLMNSVSVNRIKSAFSRHTLAPHQWSSEHVLDWLVTLPIDTVSVERSFRSHGIDGTRLLTLADRDLRALGVRDPRTRATLLDEIHDLQTGEGGGAASRGHMEAASSSRMPGTSDSLRHRAASAAVAAQLNQLMDPSNKKKQKGKSRKDKQAFALEIARKSMREAERQRHSHANGEDGYGSDYDNYDDDGYQMYDSRGDYEDARRPRHARRRAGERAGSAYGGGYGYDSYEDDDEFF